MRLVAQEDCGGDSCDVNGGAGGDSSEGGDSDSTSEKNCDDLSEDNCDELSDRQIESGDQEPECIADTINKDSSERKLEALETRFKEIDGEIQQTWGKLFSEPKKPFNSLKMRVTIQ